MRRKVWVAGHNGMVGSAIVRCLRERGDVILTVARSDLDLRDQGAVLSWLLRNKPDAIVFAAAKVGGILANNTYPAEFLYDNLSQAANVIHGAHQADIDRLIFLGSSCIYPKFAPQPLREDYLLTGPLEPTNEWYAIAKIAGIKLCQAYRRQYGRDYISVMPCNLYGPRDNFDLFSSHVLPAMIRRFYEARRDGACEVVLWGTGAPLREFLHVDDMAAGVAFCLDEYHGDAHINCGSGSEVSIRELASIVADVVGFEGRVRFDPSKPDGTPRKLMDSGTLRALGWAPSITLDEGIRQTLEWYLADQARVAA